MSGSSTAPVAPPSVGSVAAAAADERDDERESGPDLPAELQASVARMKVEEQTNARPQAGGYRFVNKEEIASQRGIMWEFLKSVGSAILEGKDLLSVSLPVRIFEPRSFLERICDNWAFAPTLLAKAVAAHDPLERFKWVVAFVVSGLCRTCTAQKPFNPILGETFQGQFSDGSTVFLEQSSHHPPISHFQMLAGSNDYHLHGYAGYKAAVRGNSVKGQQTGPNILDFRDGTRIVWELPYLTMCGIMWGQRVLDYCGHLVLEDLTHHMKCEITFNPEAVGWIASFFWSPKKPTDFFRGEIFASNTATVGKSKAKKQVLSTCEGSWLDYLSFDGVRYWDVKTDAPSPLAPTTDPLPSDSRFREDLQLLARKDLKNAHEAKTRLEEAQRADAKLRKARNAPTSPTAAQPRNK
eukprot:gnl/Hemi2/16262_TR5406_c0_g1_i1.p1 gnl/Hemi2/16262_TR5406_c0_g1~~gnl/Hemi2/16262_TR5406_c0_g1_i1.p1  ORF type:complete len:410 (-),score=155.90 gnl/Hemi2/16262_TR5406_c0_g1_i1:252-1481(-)